MADINSNGTGNGAGIVYIPSSSNSYTVKACINVGNINVPGPYAIANKQGNNCYYDLNKWTGSTPEDQSYVFAKSTSELCKLTTTDLSEHWSFAADGSRYPLPNVEETFTQFTGSDGKTVWEEIVEAADFEYPTITNENISSIVAEW